MFGPNPNLEGSFLILLYTHQRITFNLKLTFEGLINDMQKWFFFSLPGLEASALVLVEEGTISIFCGGILTFDQRAATFSDSTEPPPPTNKFILKVWLERPLPAVLRSAALTRRVWVVFQVSEHKLAWQESTTVRGAHSSNETLTGRQHLSPLLCYKR